MFFIGGISSELKPLGKAESCPCPVCAGTAGLSIIYKYMTPHVFFIPTFHFHPEYAAVCQVCASVMRLDKDKGKAFKRDRTVFIEHQDLTVLRENPR